MKSFPITREKAIEILKSYNKSEQDLIHYFESEVVMKELAERLGKNSEYWAMLGLLHDIDWGITKDKTELHLTKVSEILRPIGFDEEFINIILSHGYGFPELLHLKDKQRIEKIQHALAASETITGLIHAYALMRNKRISDMEVNGLKKKFKDKTFAAKVDREIIKECENLGLTLDEFFDISIRAIKNIKEEVGLE